MSAHKFHVGQEVNFQPRGYGRSRPAPDFRVERLLPADSNGAQYQIESLADGHRRVVREAELTEHQ